MDTPFCSQCNAPMVKRSGKFGPFFGCTNYPKCKGITRITLAKKEIVRQALPDVIVGSIEQEYISIEAHVLTLHGLFLFV